MAHQHQHHMDENSPIMEQATSEPMNMHMGMNMVFHLGIKEIVLFNFWNFNSVSGLLLSMVLIFLFGIFYEGVKFYRQRLEQRGRVAGRYATVEESGESGAPKPPSSSDTIAQIIPNDVRTANPRHGRLSLPHIFATLMYCIQVTSSLCLMLIFMTYNVWLCLAVVLGSAVGYFFFSFCQQSDGEFCH